MRALLLAAAMLAACQPTTSDLPPLEPAPTGSAPTGADWPIAKTGEACGGMMGVLCGAEGDFCKTTVADMCMAADAMGVCTPKPEVCTQQYEPICGCDDQTYGNECMANAEGISISYEGECRGS